MTHGSLAAAEVLSSALGIAVEVHDRGENAPALTRWRAVATLDSGNHRIIGYAAAPSRERARRVAVAECAERWAQFDVATHPVVKETARALGDAAIHPPSLGLYAPEQYASPGFDLMPFDPAAPLEWLACRDLHDGAERLVPIEFVHPAAPLERARLVVETSSGTAAHGSSVAATLAALCELIERDSALMLWHRQPPTRSLPLQEMRDEDARDGLAGLRRRGSVPLLLSLDYDLGVPVALAVALHAPTGFDYGLGCHPDARTAERHAVAELTHRTAERLSTRARHVAVHRALSPADHLALYDAGPLHAAVRAVLARAISTTVAIPATPETPTGDEVALNWLLEALATRGLRALVCDITPPQLREVGWSVVRALVPGLIPLYFGHERLRLGCERLTDDQAPGRLATLLPHPFG